MRIGWLKLVMNMGIDFNRTCTSYDEMRTAYIEALVDCGHTVKILTPFTRQTEETYIKLQNGTYKAEEGEWDVSFFKKLLYEPTAMADDCDLLIVENGPANWLYSCSVTNKPQIRRVAELLDSYKGLVIIEHSDPDLPFPFWKMGKKKFDWNAKGNPYRLGKIKSIEGMEGWGWATEKEVFKDKKYLVVVKSKDIDRVLDEMDGTRFGYKRLVQEGLISVAYVGQSYSYKHVGKRVFNNDPKYDLFYAGFPRNREERFELMMMNNDAWLKMAVCGPWGKKKNLDLAGRLPYHYIENLGYVKNWFQMLDYINSSKVCLYLAAKKGAKMGWETSRPFEACFCGSIVFWDEKIKGAGEMFGEELKLITENKEKMYKWLVSLSNEERQQVWNYQFNKVMNRDWYWFLNELQKEVKKIDASKEIITKKQYDDWNCVPRLLLSSKGLRPELNESFKPIIQDVVLSENQVKFGIENKAKWEKWIRSNTGRFKCFLDYDDSQTCLDCAWRIFCEPMTKELKTLQAIDKGIVESKVIETKVEDVIKDDISNVEAKAVVPILHLDEEDKKVILKEFDEKIQKEQIADAVVNPITLTIKIELNNSSVGSVSKQIG